MESHENYGGTRYIVTMVHGTMPFRRTKNVIRLIYSRLRRLILGKETVIEPAWWEPNSVFREQLSAKLLEVSFAEFSWTGRNSHGARVEAARRLGEHLHKLVQGDPTARHFVIAHSHGGNVASYAIGDNKVLRGQLAGVIALSVPFIRARPRDFGSLRLPGLLAHKLQNFFSTLSFGTLRRVDELPKLVQIEIGTYMANGAVGLSTITFIISLIWLLGTFQAQGFNFASVVLPLVIMALPLASFWMNHLLAWHSSLVILRQMKMPTFSDIPMLIIRADGDEASAFLILSQFIAWLSTKALMFAVVPLFKAGVAALLPLFLGSAVFAIVVLIVDFFGIMFIVGPLAGLLGLLTGLILALWIVTQHSLVGAFHCTFLAHSTVLWTRACRQSWSY